MESCPCNSGKSYALCCEPFLTNAKNPLTPEALMRSRYTAYTQANIDYIADTMQGSAAEDFDKEHAAHWSKHLQWLGLKVIRSIQDNDKGTVEFIATYSQNGNQENLYEISDFQKIEGKWFYIDGNTPKVGRNDNCPCGSKKKYKKCCGV